MRYAAFAVLIVGAVFFSIDAAAQQGPPVENVDPGDGGSGVIGCAECSVMPGSTYASCSYDDDGGHWADCRGGSICYSGADGSEECFPDCGRTRCYLA